MQVEVCNDRFPILPVSTSSACRIIKTVSEAIASLRPNYVNMYENIEEKMYQIARVARVIGAINCTLLKKKNINL
jgi:hypothetical protein